MNTKNLANVTKDSQAGCCCAKKSSTENAQVTKSSAGSGIPLQQLQVKGATCGGCVRSIEQALGSVAGVTQARMDLTSGIASITGLVQPNNLIAALARVGFPATVIN